MSTVLNNFPVNGTLTLRQLAAIELRVPQSGDEELDAMIREARRLDVAQAVLTGLYASSNGGIHAPANAEYIANMSTFVWLNTPEPTEAPPARED